MATGLALFPKSVARARKKMDFAGSLRFFERLGIQVTQHQHIAGVMILYDSGHESLEFLKCQFHDSLPKQKTRRAIRASGPSRACISVSARQTETGAARGHDDDGVDAPGKP
jgi:hypothetical protein